MRAASEWLHPVWIEVAVHLWQTLLVLGVLAVFARGMRRAPARWTHRLWTAGLIKLFLPLAVFGGLAESVLGGLGTRFSGSPGEQTLEALGAVINPAGRATASVGGILPVEVVTAFSCLWVGIAGWILGGLVRDLYRGLRRGGISPLEPSPRIRTRLDAALVGSGVPGDRVRFNANTIMPVVSGFRIPRILVPPELVETLSKEELHAVLLHEDEHRRRFDPFRALVQRVTLALFFCFPPVHFLLRRLRDTAEFACDEAALERGASAVIYRRALARTIKLGLDPAPGIAAALGDGRTLLRRRFDRLNHPGRYRFMPRYRLLVVLAVLLVAGGSFLPLGAVAEDDAEEQELTKLPVPTHTVAPDYPKECKKANVSGLVKVKITVSEKGEVVATEILQGVEDCSALNHAAVAAAVQWRFEPGEIDGKPVSAEMVIPFKFALD